jgi:hypothetical protein
VSEASAYPLPSFFAERERTRKETSWEWKGNEKRNRVVSRREADFKKKKRKRKKNPLLSALPPLLSLSSSSTSLRNSESTKKACRIAVSHKEFERKERKRSGRD